MLTTPSSISPDVLRLCSLIVETPKPTFVPVRVEPGAVFRYCFQAVADKVARDGGACVYGWMIWEYPGFLVEGEFHAIWQDPAGALVDISPKPDGEQLILFLADSTRCWNYRPTPSVRLPLSMDQRVLNTIVQAVATDWLRMKYWDGEEARIPPQAHLEFMKDPISNFLRTGRNDSCGCGSGKKFKQCCLPMIQKCL